MSIRPGRRLALVLMLSAVALAGCQGGASAPATPTPVPVTEEVLAVPAAIASPSHPVLWYRDGDASLHLVAYDWNGNRAGELQLHAGAPVGITPSRDGSRLLVVGATTVSGAPVLRRLDGSGAVWSDDDQHLCQFRARDGRPVAGRPESRQVPASLWLVDLGGGADRRVLDFGAYGGHGGPAVLACDVAADRAMIGTTFTASYTDLRMVRLHDGATLPLGLQAPTQRGLVVSAEGRYAGLGDTAGSTGGPGAPGFDVLDAAGGAVLGHVGSGGLVGFSGDDSLAMIVAWQDNSNEVGIFSLVDWRTGAVLWTHRCGQGTITARPGTGDFLFGEPHRVDGGGNRAATITEEAWIVRRDGSTVHLGSGFGALY